VQASGGRAGGHYAVRVIEGGETLDRVRGSAGSVAHWISRGDSLGWIEAAWQEEGTDWLATAPVSLGVTGLAETLASWRLSDHGPSDPSGRFVEIGRDALALPEPVGTTVIDLGPPGSSGVAPIHVLVRPRATGSSGLTELPQGSDTTVTDVAGRMVASGSHEAIAELPDGSLAVASALRADAPGPAPALAVPRVEQLQQLVLSLVAVAPDDPRLATVAMPPLFGDATRCRETG
ncbi:MAG: hypothetical protein REI45_15145, partial [Propionicimonas sp.]|nr:hypothetical protein [Propionicimonas sp.]